MRDAIVAAAALAAAALVLGWLKTVLTGGILGPLALISAFVNLGAAARRLQTGFRDYAAQMRAAHVQLEARLAEIDMDLDRRLDELWNDYVADMLTARDRLSDCLAANGCPRAEFD